VLASFLVGAGDVVLEHRSGRERNGYAEMGVFLGGQPVAANAVLFLPGLIGQVMLPVVSDLWGQNRFREPANSLLGPRPSACWRPAPFCCPMFLVRRQIMSMYGPRSRRAARFCR